MHGAEKRRWASGLVSPFLKRVLVSIMARATVGFVSHAVVVHSHAIVATMSRWIILMSGLTECFAGFAHMSNLLARISVQIVVPRRRAPEVHFGRVEMDVAIVR